MLVSKGLDSEATLGYICCVASIVKAPNCGYKFVGRFSRGHRARTVPTLELAKRLQRKAQELGLSTSTWTGRCVKRLSQSRNCYPGAT